MPSHILPVLNSEALATNVKTEKVTILEDEETIKMIMKSILWQQQDQTLKATLNKTRHSPSQRFPLNHHLLQFLCLSF